MVTSIPAILTFLQQSHLSSGPVFSGKGACFFFFFYLVRAAEYCRVAIQREKKPPKLSIIWKNQLNMLLQDFTRSCPAAEAVGQRSFGSAASITPGRNRSKDLVQLGLGVTQGVRDFKVNQAASKKNNLELTSLRWEPKWPNPMFRIQDMNQSQRWIWDWFMSYITEKEKWMDYTPSHLQGAIQRFSPFNCVSSQSA